MIASWYMQITWINVVLIIHVTLYLNYQRPMFDNDRLSGLVSLVILSVPLSMTTWVQTRQ